MSSGATAAIEKLTKKNSPLKPQTARSDAVPREFTFADRHIGPDAGEIAEMLAQVGFENIDALIDATVPKNIRLDRPLDLPAAKSEIDALTELRALAHKNKVARSFIGAGYSDTITPPVIQRNVLENPGWYTAYTPYQAELAQGRLEALVNFQTMVTDLTALDIANASLLDEATAAAEAMALCHATVPNRKKFFVSDNCHPQTIAVVRTRAKPLGLEIVSANFADFKFDDTICGALVQYPATDGAIYDYEKFAQAAHDAGALLVVAADILSLTLLKPPGEFGADVAVGSTQRFGVPLGFGGPHAAYMATRDQFKRHLPGRLVGVSHDADGRPAYRLALQTREQHIRRDKATSNICTAQVLLAVIASMYAVYHGPRGLTAIAQRVHRTAAKLASELQALGFEIAHENFFDTIRVTTDDAKAIAERADRVGCNLRVLASSAVAIAVDETTTDADIEKIVSAFRGEGKSSGAKATESSFRIPQSALRTSRFLTHPIFNTHETETEMLRYLRKLEARDLSLCHSMIPLGSCTMKLNATAEMFPISWPEFARMHPFAPDAQSVGYREMCEQLERWLAEITGFAAVSLQPNAGSQGEYAGLLAIREFHATRGEGHRNVCLIPQSAHGTNPASAVMAGFKVVPIATLKDGDIDLADLRTKTDLHKNDLGALMVTYPSTHGVFETTIREICEIVHAHGGQVYMDGANMNAQVGLCRPGDIGADVCHLNLHKTFCIPHGGGGPGVGPIGVTKHLAPFLPARFALSDHSQRAPVGPVSAAPWGSASILTISWMYIRMMGERGLTLATKVAILNANYIAKRLSNYFPILFQGRHGLVAHECILDLRDWKRAGIEVEDIAKRLMDYGFHAPTVSWPVAGTMMVEPTESEPKQELDRFCDAMISIHAEMKAIADGKADKQNNVLKNAPHTIRQIASSDWAHPYSREEAAYPAPWLHDYKFWPSVARIDNVYGDRNLFCSCVPMDDLPE
ncbi:MAG: aminomethyl-transferring glycine dehydrogenase [Verrucomicrobiota bacterium]|nr:aminomethyl-transferring glycine dehydrogenase [Verrucomicrobiota bacterium]